MRGSDDCWKKERRKIYKYALVASAEAIVYLCALSDLRITELEVFCNDVDCRFTTEREPEFRTNDTLRVKLTC